ncbi:MAG: tRNA dihydrouridine synthase DusB [Peptococcaceae bacterium]|nr:tRNA dihydrouridine synthase DusB [Peptococcaceae bacterium]
MDIGGVKLSNPVIAAPMAGVTDRAFRTLAREAGCGLVHTEMVSDQALIYGSSRTGSILDIDGEPGPLAVQIFGSNPRYMEKAASMVAARKPQLIDINMGCPTPKIVRNGEGAALMRNPRLAYDLARAVVTASGIPVTVKMRKGWDEDQVNAVELAVLMEKAGVSAVTVHGRTRSQFYSGRADWNIIREVKKAVGIPVIGNGDVREPLDARRMMDETGCDGVMVGRAAMGNPWIFTRIIHFLETGEILPPPTLEERISTALRHLDLLVRLKGEYTGVREMRKHAAWYLKGMPGAARTRQEINHAETREEMICIISRMLQY